MGTFGWPFRTTRPRGGSAPRGRLEEEVDDKIIGTFGECRKSDGSKGEGTASVEGADMDSRTEDVLGFSQRHCLI